MHRTNFQKITLLGALFASACIVGGADDCFGSSDAPISVGDADDMGVPPGDMGMLPVDMGALPLDMGVLPVDMGARAATWRVEAIGNTDDDIVITLRIDAAGEKHIAHFGEAGFGYYDHTDGGVWQPQVTFVSVGPGTGCDILDGMDIDSSGRAHIAYRVPVGGCRGIGSYYDTPSEIHYVVIDGSAVGTSSLIETIERGGVQPFVVVDSSDTVHIVYDNSAGDGTRYVSVDAGVVSAPVDIPGVTGVPTGFAKQASDNLVLLYQNATETSVTARVGSTWGTRVIVDDEALGASLAIGPDDRVHLGYTADLAHGQHLSLDATLATRSAVSSVPAPSFGADGSPVLNIGVSASNEVAMVFGRTGYGVAVTSLDGTVWGDEPYIMPPAGSPLPQQVTPSLAYESDGTPNVVFQGWGANDLYLAIFE